ncbi:MAG TPA: type II toxin-antitoxin system RelE/ParE family toxin [Pirellulales bacterium]|nr:type II toxin-antitoxin system RelE/ParE family toxin [Pirellulales bacterium]
MEQAVRWFETVHAQLRSLADFPERNAAAAESDDFPYEIRDKLLGLGSRRGYRAVFTIRDAQVYVLTVRRASQDALRPEDVDPPHAP